MGKASSTTKLRVQELPAAFYEVSTTCTKTQRLTEIRPEIAKVCCFQSMESGFQCAACGEWNTTSVDESAGRRQSYVEDCQVCCKPNVLRVEYDNSSQEFFIAAERE
jgi:hypothetical protein